jgi:transcriptional regulator with XRE-family HTH domain
MYAKYAELRDAKGLTDGKVSEQTGIPRSTFTDWKQGRSAPKVEKLMKIADLFKVTLDELVR